MSTVLVSRGLCLCQGRIDHVMENNGILKNPFYTLHKGPKQTYVGFFLQIESHAKLIWSKGRTVPSATTLLATSWRTILDVTMIPAQPPTISTPMDMDI